MDLFKKIISAVASFSMAVSAVSATAYADENRGFTEAQIESSAVKPAITVESKVIDFSDLYYMDNRVPIDISISGAELKYSSTGMHIYYDSRLIVEKNFMGKPDIKSGKAIEYLGCYNVSEDETASQYGMKGLFLATSGEGNYGMDGVMWTINFILPYNAQEGDVYPIDIVYRETDETFDIFSDVFDTEQGKLMSAYTFTRGIYNSMNLFTPSYEDMDRCPNLYNNVGGDADGYIAIAIPVTTTTTTTITTTTTETTTTTKTTTTETSTLTTTTTTATTSTAPTKIIYGDANCDGEVNIADATAIIQAIGNKDRYALSEQGEINGDVDGVKGITGMDAITIQKVEAGIFNLEDLPLR